MENQIVKELVCFEEQIGQINHILKIISMSPNEQLGLLPKLLDLEEAVNFVLTKGINDNKFLQFLLNYSFQQDDFSSIARQIVLGLLKHNTEDMVLYLLTDECVEILLKNITIANKFEYIIQILFIIFNGAYNVIEMFLDKINFDTITSFYFTLSPSYELLSYFANMFCNIIQKTSYFTDDQIKYTIDFLFENLIQLEWKITLVTLPFQKNIIKLLYTASKKCDCSDKFVKYDIDSYIMQVLDTNGHDIITIVFKFLTEITKHRYFIIVPFEKIKSAYNTNTGNICILKYMLHSISESKFYNRFDFFQWLYEISYNSVFRCMPYISRLFAIGITNATKEVVENSLKKQTITNLFNIFIDCTQACKYLMMSLLSLLTTHSITVDQLETYGFDFSYIQNVFFEEYDNTDDEQIKIFYNELDHLFNTL